MKELKEWFKTRFVEEIFFPFLRLDGWKLLFTRFSPSMLFLIVPHVDMSF